ncbi:MAG: TetR/AcrR family transcriptional regulator [Myxococcales bacterium]|nr:TetR/AcrR family transcriptional regulator [Myxococcales bacterium]MCB9578004.1 TetR/AcrR family transcriptional regulator [Polyangiaceae bacterium]
MTTIESAHTETPAMPNTSNGDGAARGVDWDNPRVSAILAAAAKCFARKGFSATTLAEIGKELGLRKSIVHYYFASKAALIHEVQAYSQHKYLDRVRDAIRATAAEEPKKRMMSVLGSLWEVLDNNRTTTHLNIEVWSASRRDPELRRRASLLQHDARQLITDGVGDVLGVKVDQFPQMKALSALILAVLNGLVVAEYLEGEEAGAKEAYDTFLYLLRLGMKKMEEQAAGTA